MRRGGEEDDDLDKTWSLFSAWPVTTSAQWFGTPNTEQGYKNIHTSTLLLLFFPLHPVFHSYLTSSLLCSYLFSSCFNAGHVLFCFLGLIFLRRATYVIMLFVSTNLYHRHVRLLSCFKCVCVLSKVLLALIFHPQDIFYFCSFLFLFIFCLFCLTLFEIR